MQNKRHGRTKLTTIISAFVLTIFIAAPAAAAGSQSLSIYAGINVSQSLYEQVVREYEKAPVSVKLAFLNDGWGIGILSYDLDSLYYSGAYGSVAGTTRYSENMIYVENRKAGVNAVIHEMGHYLDGKLGMLSQTPEWQALQASEVPNVSNYATTNAMEGFAESFSKYIHSPDTLQNNCPGIFAYITQTVEKINQLHTAANPEAASISTSAR